MSNTALAHPHDEQLTSTARVLATVPDRAEREAAARELRHQFCTQLRAARERKGISLQTIAEATKVSEGLFTDLERGDVSRWPTGIYRRAFFREYAAFIGQPGDSTVGEFIRLFPDELVRGSADDTLVPGPLRLTLARPFWRHLSPVYSQAAAIDVVMVLAWASLLAGVTSTSFWASLGIVALIYHVLGTVACGCSPATWWVRAHLRRSALSWILPVVLAAGVSQAEAQEKPFQPEVGQAGKDVVWVPTPEAMVERMLDMAQVTPQDFVMDLGSGDGRNVIGAAKRGANALGVEYNPDMVALSKRLATEAGVGGRAQFVQGDMFEADISKADVLALFLLPSNMLRLRDKFLNLRPGARIVSNTFSIQDWDADETVVLDDCEQWCTALLYIVPAKVGGTWRIGSDVLELKQDYQMLSGTLTSGDQTLSVFGQMRGTEMSFKAGDRAITGRVQGNQIEGTVRAGDQTSAWRATRSGS
jgi:transcriptional regulator with XRE-family HTH domain